MYVPKTFLLQFLLVGILLAAAPACHGLLCACNTPDAACEAGVKDCQDGLADSATPVCSFTATAYWNVTQNGGRQGIWHLRYGCGFDLSKSGIGSLLWEHCRPSNDPNGYSVRNCCRTAMCNDPRSMTLQRLPTIPPTVTHPDDTTAELSSNHKAVVTAVAVVGGCLLLAGVVLVVLSLCRSRKHQGKSLLPLYKATSCHTASIKPSMFAEEAQPDTGFSLGDSSGRGMLQLEQRTVSREISLVARIGTGRYGEVYRGEWRGNAVAVKIFKTMDEDSFFREVELFNTNMLRHENIVGFQAADNRDCNMETQLWMVLDYHCNGSLFDYLRHRTSASPHAHASLTMTEALRLAATTAAGLSHLHLHIGGSNGFQSFGHKPSIAHRDLKTKNILVKATGACCIADLGMSVREGPDCDDLTRITHANLRAGTRRYMAPEILDGSINIELFESFRQADMYSLAVVLWEIMSCCHLSGCKEPCYQLPFENLVPGDPSADEMYKVVCSAALRPTVPDFWQNHEELKQISRILRSCWKANPSSRLPAQNVSKKLAFLLENTAAAKSVQVPVKCSLEKVPGLEKQIWM